MNERGGIGDDSSKVNGLLDRVEITVDVQFC